MSPSAEKLQLHIGGETRRDGWKILNLRPGAHVDYVADCTELSLFAPDSVAEIYASHVFEHLGYLDALPRALAECHRVLVSGGALRISVPDLETLCRPFLHPELGVEGRFHVMRMMFGGQTDPHDFHKAGLTYAFLEDYLRVAGFRGIERVDAFGLFEGTSTLRFGGVPLSLNVQAVK